IEFRKINEMRRQRGQPPLKLGVTEPPHGGMPSTYIATRAAMVYAGGQHKDLSTLFLAFLASEEYNMQIVRDGDALPPNPVFTEREEFRNPPDFPEEWGVHERFARAAKGIAIAPSYSPFVLHQVANRIESQWRDKFMNHLVSAEEAAAEMERQINAEIARSLQENPDLRPIFDQRVIWQKEINRRTAILARLEQRGEAIPDELKIPMQWVDNEFYRVYYTHKGWLITADEGAN